MATEAITRNEIETLLNGGTITRHISTQGRDGVALPIVLEPEARVWLLAQRPKNIWRTD